MKSDGSGPPRWTLSGILAVFLLLGLLYAWQVPPFEGPDEGEHFAYITWLVETGTFPPQGAAAWDTPVRQEAGQPPLYYLLASVPARLIDLDDPPAPYRVNPYAFSRLGRTDNQDNDNRALHYPGDGRPFRGGWLALYIARGISLAAGLVLVSSVFALAREILPDRPAIATGAAAFVALLPQVLFVSSVASNDMLATALSTVTLWLLARLIRRGATVARGLALGSVFGLALLAKISTALLAVPIAIAFAWVLWRRDPPRQVIRAGLAMLVTALAVAGWWFVRAWLLYGSPLGLEAHDYTSWAIGPDEQVAVWYARWGEVFRSFWAAFGWGTIRPPEGVYLVLALLTILGLLGLGRALWRWWRQGRQLTTVAIFALLLLALLLGTGIFLEIWMRRVIAQYGRLLFPALATVALGLSTGWRELHPRLPTLALGSLGLLALLSPLLVIRPAFQPPRPLTDAEVASLPALPVARFAVEGEAPVAELASAEPLARSHPVATLFPVKLCWRVLRPASENYTVLVHLVGPNDGVVSSRRTYPGLGRYPTQIWQPGNVFCDRVEIYINEGLEQTLVYRIEVAMLDETTGRRLQATGPDGQPQGIVFVGDVLLEAAQTERLPLSGEGPAVRLLDYDVPSRWQAGTTESFTLRWGVAEAVGADYQLFVHLRDRDTELPVAQADGAPLDGWYPTSWWAPDAVIVDGRSFPLPADVPPGRYQLVVGFYDLQTGVPFGPAFDLGVVEVVS
jgi:hypothetical protein